MIVTADILAETVVGLLQTAGVADGRVYGVRAFPTPSDSLPQVQLQLPSEQKRSLGRTAGNQFVVTATLPLIITVQAPAAPNEAGAAEARGQLRDLVRQIEATLIGAPSLQQMIQRVAAVDTHPRVDGTGAQIIGEAVWLFSLEFYQGPEDFFVQTPVPLQTITVSDPPDAEVDAGAERLLLGGLNPTS